MKIEYPDKQSAVEPLNPGPNEQTRAEDLNEIKNVVNANDDSLLKVTNVAPVSTFKGWFTQTGTNAPTVENVKSNFENAPTYLYGGVGFITIVLTGVTAHEKINVAISQKRQASKAAYFSWLPLDSGGNTRILVYGYNLSNNALENDLMVKTPITIEIFA